MAKDPQQRDELTKLTNNLIDSDDDDDDEEVTAPGEFIFVVDRSGSMSGAPMETTKDALKLFLRSLPADSKFNIISFGNRFEFAYPTSQFNNNKNLKDALKKVEYF
jgi:uncharacterized protein with von Willebrand factor type A (vWA) domain